MTTKIKEPVRIREKKLRNGNISLYLAINIDGRREYEFLKLYLRPELTKQDKAINRETLALANAIKAQRVLDIQNGRHGFRTEKSKIPFVDYLQHLIDVRCTTEGNRKCWVSARGYVQHYAKGDVLLCDITANWLKGFREYLLSEHSSRLKLSANTAYLYFTKIKTALRQARADELIGDDFSHVPGIAKKETNRNYLTLDEVRRLAATDCRLPEVKRAFLFSCLTGLRRSDIEKLTWGEVVNADGRTRLIFRQKKTGGLEYLDITQQAAELIGERGTAKSDDKVFGHIHWVSSTNSNIREWALRAGIDKHITFHSGRHTFAVLMLSLGTEIYTVSKLLGHRNLATTQIYAKIVDKKKQEAVDNIPRIL